MTEKNHVPEISSDELEALLKEQELTLLDVRVPEQYHSGHIPEAINLPLAEIDSYQGPLTEKVYLVCRTGNKSQQAAEILREKGYEAISMTGGMYQWFGEVEA